jgi:hypothetical protein
VANLPIKPPTGGQTQAVSAPAAPHYLSDPCQAQIEKDGQLKVTFYLDPVIAKRLEGRAGKQPLGEYLWQNVLRRAVEGHVF